MYFNKMKNAISNTKLKIDVNKMKKNFDFLKLNEKITNTNFKEKLKSPKPFEKNEGGSYWSFNIKNKIQQEFQKFDEKLRSLFLLKNPFKLLNSESSNKDIEKFDIKSKGALSSTIKVVKNTALKIIGVVNNIVKIITFNKIDLYEIKNALMKFETFALILNKTSKSVIFIGNNIKKGGIIIIEKILKKLEKYKDNEFNREFNKKNYELSNRIEENYHKRNKLISRIIPSFINSFKMMFEIKNVSKINKFMNMPRTVQKAYYVKNYFSNFFGKFKRIEKSTAVNLFSYDNFLYQSKRLKEKKKILNPFYLYRNIKYITTRLLIKIAFYLIGIIFIYKLFKYFLRRIFSSRSDKDLREALNLVKDLKSQNEELLKFNQKFLMKLEERENANNRT